MVMDYRDCFGSAVRGMTRFMGLAEAVLAQIDDLISLITAMPGSFSLDLAEGVQLDQVGTALNISRPIGMTDTDYRSLIKKKLRLWQWNGTNEEVAGVLADIDPGGAERDNDNLSVTISPSGELTADAKELYPLPAGVTVGQ